MLPRALLPLLLLIALPACDEPKGAPAPVASTTASTAAPPKASPPPTASAAPEKTTVELLRFTLTSEIKAKEPVDHLESAEPGQRVYAHLAVRNRTGGARRVTLRFIVNGDERSTVDLNVEQSWSYRTWGYNTVRAGDKSGELVVEVRDDQGELLKKATLPIKGKGAGR
ncbi:MAG: DUF2914 domain-containing protein [Byssovorax sp.]